MMNKDFLNTRQKSLLAIHDLSGFGNTSLMAVIPIMYSMGISVCALPTTFLSANTCFEGYQKLQDNTFLHASIAHWKSIGKSFDAIYSGFLADASQAMVVEQALETFAGAKPIVLIDPVLADDGKLYSCYDNAMVDVMRALIKRADIITPNYTEACLLAGVEYSEHIDKENMDKIGFGLIESGAANVIVTGVPDIREDICNVFAFSKGCQESKVFECRYLPYSYPGTGDIFSSVLLGSMLSGQSLANSIQKAIDFVYKAILISRNYVHDPRAGVVLEHAIQELRDESE